MGSEGDRWEQMWKEMSHRQLRSLLKGEHDLRKHAEQIARDARAGYEYLIEGLCPNLVDKIRLDDPAGTTKYTLNELRDMVYEDVRERLFQVELAKISGQSLESLFDETRNDLQQEREISAQLREELDESERARERLELRLGVVEQSLADAQRRLSEEGWGKPTPISPERTTDGPLPDAALPEWVQKWRRESSHERDLTLLRILAETGLARRSVAAEMFAEEQGLQSPGSGTVSRAFQRFERKGLIEAIKVRSETSGNSMSYLIRLTEKGRDASRALLGKDPVLSQLTELLERHKTLEHTLLNLEAGDLLREAGYEIDLFPSQVNLPDGRLVVPDLSALSPYGELLLVEVERDTEKHDRRRKWENCRDANGGALYVVVANDSALTRIKSEILFWAGRDPLKLWMSSISDDRGKKGESVWSFKRG